MLIERFLDYRLPRAERMLEDVQAGQKLTDDDIAWLKRIYQEDRGNQSLLTRHPEYMKVVSGYIDLYVEIVHTGLENETSN